MRISDWSSDVCSSDLDHALDHVPAQALVVAHQPLERPWHAGKHAFDQRALVRRRVRGRVDGLRCLHTDGDTPTAVTVASAICTVRPGCNRWRHGRIQGPCNPDHKPGTRPAMNFDILLPINILRAPV